MQRVLRRVIEEAAMSDVARAELLAEAARSGSSAHVDQAQVLGLLVDQPMLANPIHVATGQDDAAGTAGTGGFMALEFAVAGVTLPIPEWATSYSVMVHGLVEIRRTSGTDGCRAYLSATDDQANNINGVPAKRDGTEITTGDWMTWSPNTGLTSGQVPSVSCTLWFARDTAGSDFDYRGSLSVLLLATRSTGGT